MEENNVTSADMGQVLWMHPPLKGEVFTQYVDCRKPGCRCQQGHLHGPYYYRVWREGDRVQKVYVKFTELEAVRGGCEAHKELTKHLREMREQRKLLTRNLQSEWRRSTRFSYIPRAGLKEAA